jgi:hypothetical protein
LLSSRSATGTSARPCMQHWSRTPFLTAEVERLTAEVERVTEDRALWQHPATWVTICGCGLCRSASWRKRLPARRASEKLDEWREISRGKHDANIAARGRCGAPT